jgi:transcriptional regulator GlxA family with amidase domain
MCIVRQLLITTPSILKLTGTSPLAHLKTERLNRVYRVLHDSDPNEVLIKQIAYSNGFNHLGQSCRDYKQVFG